MVIEAKGTYRGKTGELPASVYHRQSWRPAALRGLVSLLSNISRQNEAFDFRRARLTAWHKQFSRRLQPLMAWSPLRREFGGENSYSSGQLQMKPTGASSSEETTPTFAASPTPPQAQGSAIASQRSLPAPEPAEAPFLSLPAMRLATLQATRPAAGRTLGSEAGLTREFGEENSYLSRQQQMKPTGAGASSSEETTPTFATSPAPPQAQGSAIASQRSPAAPEPAEAPPLSRPAMRLAALQATRPAALFRSRVGRPLFSAETNDLLDPDRLPLADRQTIESRLVLVSSVSSFPRQEVRGGFPASSPLWPRLPESERIRLEPVVSQSPPWMRIPQTPSPAQSPQASAVGSVGAIERLIEQTVLPTALPGLEVRLVSPDMPPPETPRSRADAEEGGEPAVTVPKSLQRPTSSSLPPQLDVNAVAEKVYHLLQRRQLLERERRGL
jgi:hypothetical protein